MKLRWEFENSYRTILIVHAEYTDGYRSRSFHLRWRANNYSLIAFIRRTISTWIFFNAQNELFLLFGELWTSLISKRSTLDAKNYYFNLSHKQFNVKRIIIHINNNFRFLPINILDHFNWANWFGRLFEWRLLAKSGSRARKHVRLKQAIGA